MKIKYILIILFSLLIISGCQNKEERINKEMNLNIKININNKDYIVKLNDNNTTKEFIKLLPINIEMQELNGNEKYYYLDNTLPTNSYNPKQINKGDLMLYGNNCLVLFYDTFNTSYSYTYLGHINNLEDIDNSDILVKIEEYK